MFPYPSRYFSGDADGSASGRGHGDEQLMSSRYPPHTPHRVRPRRTLLSWEPRRNMGSARRISTRGRLRWLHASFRRSTTEGGPELLPDRAPPAGRRRGDRAAARRDLRKLSFDPRGLLDTDRATLAPGTTVVPNGRIGFIVDRFGVKGTWECTCESGSGRAVSAHFPVAWCAQSRAAALLARSASAFRATCSRRSC